MLFQHACMLTGPGAKPSWARKFLARWQLVDRRER